jgi:hypothetical protein
MSRNKIAAAALLATLPLAAVAVTAGAADAASHGPQAKITAQVSDKTPAANKPFTVSGRFTEGGKAAGEQVVKVLAKQANGTWKTLPGAKDQTSRTGGYNIKVILNAKGTRVLRVVGVGLSTLPNGYQTFGVSVH